MKINYKINKISSVRQWFREHYMNITYNELQKYIRVKDIRLNNQKTNPQQMLSIGDTISVWDKIPRQMNVFDPRKDIIDPSLILYQDNNICAINKPYNISSQGEKYHSVFLLMQNWLAKTDKRCYVVHRLDKCTTGVLLFALNRETAAQIAETIHEWDKRYIAAIEKTNLSCGTIQTTEEGKELVTNYKILSTNENHSIAEFRPVTGKKHQIRKHAIHFGYPIIGDNRYGNDENIKMQLHCKEISFKLNKQKISIRAPFPKHMQHIVLPDQINLAK